MSQKGAVNIMRLSRTFALACAALAVATAACSGNPSGGGTDAQLQSGTTSDEPTPSTEPAAQPFPTDDPSRVEAGTPYRFKLSTHCGVDLTVLVGRDWEAEPPVPEPSEGSGWPLHTPGTIELVDADTLRFTIDDSSEVAPGAVITFRPTKKSVPICD